MAERRGYAKVRPGAPAIGPLPRQPGSPLAGELAQFGQTMLDIGAKLNAGAAEEQAQRDVAGGKFKPRGNVLGSSRAYNRAGFDAYFDNLRITTADEVERIYQQHGSDPAALESALSGYQEGIEKNLGESMPGLLAPFRAYFDRASRPFRSKAAEDYQKAQADSQDAETLGYLTSKERQDETRAFMANGSPDSAADLALSRNEYLDGLLRMAPPTAFKLNGREYEADPSRTGKLDLPKVQASLQAYDRMIVSARVKGEFKRAQKGGRGEKFVARFADDAGWQKRGVTIDERGQLVNWMQNELADEARLRAADNQALRASVNAAAGALWRGETPGGLDQLQASVRGTDLEPELQAAVSSNDLMAQVRKMPPAAVDGAIAREREALGRLSASAPDYAVAVAAGTRRIAGMEALRAQTVAALQQDPYAWGVEVGLVPAPPLLNEDGTLNAAALVERSRAAAALSAHAGVEAAPIARAEAGALAAGLVASGPQGLHGADEPTREAMRRAVRLMAPDFPQVAQITTAAMNGRRSPADGASLSTLLQRGYALTAPQRGPDGKAGTALFTFKAGAEGKASFDEQFNSYVGDAFTGNAAARQAAQDGVLAVYAAYAEAAPEGLTGAFDGKTFERAAAAYFGGAKVKINGGAAFPPYGMAADDFEFGLATDVRLRLKDMGYTPDQIEAAVRNGAPQNAASGYVLTVGDAYLSDAAGVPIVFNPRTGPETVREREKLRARGALARESEAR